MAVASPPPSQRPPARRTRPVESSASWPLIDRLGLAACYVAGIGLLLITATILVYLAVRGAQYLEPRLFVESPVADNDQAKSGGFFDPLVGTMLLTTIGISIAAPLGAAVGIWLSEYGRPAGLARAVESGVEVIAGTPSIVLALFGLTVFSNGIFAPLSFTSEGGGVFGRSFIIAGLMMSLIALPLVVGTTREALQQIPSHVREASYALGKTRAATIRRVLLPAARPGIAAGATLGMGRIIGDTAIVVVLLGASLEFDPAGETPVISFLQGTGSTLTSYVYTNSPAGDGNAPEKAYAAAFVLLLIVLFLNAAVTRITRGRAESPSWIR
ncbi:phosphate ABC transporter permease PstA [Paraconexibacter algicola]|nr:phosphate ABC transporter permease PstA [Paraconexibacter algicola]